MVVNMGKERKNLYKEVIIRETSKTEKLVAMEQKDGPMVLFTKENGMKINQMAKESLLLYFWIHLRDNFWILNLSAIENFLAFKILKILLPKIIFKK